MASIQDLYTAITNAAQVLSNLAKTMPRAGGNVTAINNLSSAGFISVISSNNGRSNISFHNPGSNTVFVAPTTQGSSNTPFNPTQLLLGGTFQITPGGWVVLTGQVQQGYQAAVTAGSSQPLTIMDQ